jgi:hypothetical protein
MGDGDLRTTLVIGARLLCGWAFIAVALLDLITGFQPGLYLVFHLVLLAGGLLLLQKPLPRLAYGVITALALVTAGVAALPATGEVCCMHGVDVRHGYPFTLLGWRHGGQHHFAAAHAVADLTFWFLGWMIIVAVVVRVRTVPAAHSVPPAPAVPVADDESVGRLP